MGLWNNRRLRQAGKYAKRQHRYQVDRDMRRDSEQAWAVHEPDYLAWRASLHAVPSRPDTRELANQRHPSALPERPGR